MKLVWFPMSALLDGEIDCWASPVMLKMPLAAGQAVRVRYVGDHMWPAFVHGEPVDLQPLPATLERGAAVVALTDGNVELWRVAEATEHGVRIVGDASAEPPHEIGREALIGLAAASGAAPGARVRRWRRARLELAEAWRGCRERSAESVRRKYDGQAEAYAEQEAEPSAEWRETVRRHLGGSGRVLVVGSGTGQECRSLAALGFEVHGLDFSERMVELAERRLAGSPHASRVRFEQADIRGFEPPAGSLAGVLFTPDVFSFVPRRADRYAVLRRLAEGVVPGGRLLLHARVARAGWARWVLALEWLRGGRGAEPGDSHTRFLTPDGAVHRSFVHCFSERSLRREISRAGLRVVVVERGFHVLST